MRIAQLAPLAESVPPKLYGGTERVVAWLVDELVDLGHHVTLFASCSASIWMGRRGNLDSESVSRRRNDCRADCRAQEFCLNSDCRGASISDGFGCRVRWWPSRTAFSVERGASAIALDVHLNDGGVVNETIDGGERHGGVREDLVPFAERLIGGDQHGAPLQLELLHEIGGAGE